MGGVGGGGKEEINFGTESSLYVSPGGKSSILHKRRGGGGRKGGERIEEERE